MRLDWKKEEKPYYLPGTEPVRVAVPAFKFFVVGGAGDPNGEGFQEYVEVLYALSYAVKMSPKSGNAPAGYLEYSVFPLEGVWDISDEAKRGSGYSASDKSVLTFDLMMRQPDFVDEAYALKTIARVGDKKPLRLLSGVRFEAIDDGDCVQMLHRGSYDDEPASFAKMEAYCAENGLARASLTHREIYMSDPRRTSPEKMKTVLRFKVLAGPRSAKA